jgi:hypothetical protein
MKCIVEWQTPGLDRIGKKHTNIMHTCKAVGLKNKVHFKTCQTYVHFLHVVDQYFTVRRRLKEKTQPANKAHVSQQLLSPAQEDVLADWMRFLGALVILVNKKTIAPKVEALCSRRPNEKCIVVLLLQHKDIIGSHGSGIDPKRARAFNYKTVQKYFEL